MATESVSCPFFSVWFVFEDSLLRYEKGIKLAGIIYLERITDNHMTGTSYRHLRLFVELCGPQAMKNVVLVTTMWDRASLRLRIARETIAARERQLFDRYWNVMLQGRASTARFENTPASAWEIVDIILRQDKAEVLLLQEEIVDHKRALHETAAGEMLYTDLQRVLVNQRDLIRSLAQEALAESNPELAHVLKTEMKRIRKDIDKTMNNLKIPFSKRLMLLFDKQSRGVSYSSILGLFYFCTHCLVRSVLKNVVLPSCQKYATRKHGN